MFTMSDEYKKHILLLGEKSDQEIISTITHLGNVMGNLNCGVSRLGFHLSLQILHTIEHNSGPCRTIVLTLCNCHYTHHTQAILELFLAWCITRGHLTFEDIIVAIDRTNDEYQNHINNAPITVLIIACSIVFSAMFLWTMHNLLY